MLHELPVASETTAGKDLSVVVNNNNQQGVAFAADDPLRSVFAAIQEGTRWMLQLAAGQQIGDNMAVDYESLNRWFDGSVKTNIQSRDYLALIAGYSLSIDAYMATLVATAASSLAAADKTAVIAQNINLTTTAMKDAGLRVNFDRGTADGTSGGPVFATGAAFRNGIVTRPTGFDIGTMGEAGPEGILPLANIGGRLGVYANGGRDDKVMLALLAEIRQLRAEAAATARSTYKTSQSLDSVITGGESVKTEAWVA